MKNIFLTVTIGSDYTLLRKFLKYYTNLGINKFLPILNTPDTTPQVILQEHGINISDIWIEPFSEQAKQYHEREVILRYCTDNDWVVYADLDEFQQYPMELKNHIRYCEENNIDFLEGKLIDRVSSTGKLREIISHRTLEEQFPLKGYITKNLLKAWDKKIVIARGKLIVGGGHHVFLDRATYKPLSYKSILNEHSYGIEVHHFKWDDKLLNRMQSYLNLRDKSLFFWKKEIVRFMNHYYKHSRINIEDKRFKFIYAENDYHIK
jgi:hypothetical protein